MIMACRSFAIGIFLVLFLWEAPVCRAGHGPDSSEGMVRSVGKLVQSAAKNHNACYAKNTVGECSTNVVNDFSHREVKAVAVKDKKESRFFIASCSSQGPSAEFNAVADLPTMSVSVQATTELFSASAGLDGLFQVGVKGPVAGIGGEINSPALLAQTGVRLEAGRVEVKSLGARLAFVPNLNTGVSISPNGVGVQILGVGIGAGLSSISFQLPIGEFEFKWW